MSVVELLNESRYPAEDARTAVTRALEEDHASDDVTTRWVVPEDGMALGQVVSRGPGIVAGVEVVAEVYRQLDRRVLVTALVPDGSRTSEDQPVLTVEGPARSIVTGERVALNFLQRLSGIATGAAAFVEAVADLPVTILDTRKTVPGLRALDKYAVTCGGASNHRRDLSTMVLIKENHLAAAAGVTAAVAAVRRGCGRDGHDVDVEVEVDNATDAAEAMDCGVDWVLLDNMSIEDMREVVSLRDETPAYSSVRLEASGEVTIDNVRQVALAGVDAISVGALTHSVEALDLSMMLQRFLRPEDRVPA